MRGTEEMGFSPLGVMITQGKNYCFPLEVVFPGGGYFG